MTAVSIDEGVFIAAFHATSAKYLGSGSYGETWCVEGIVGQPSLCAVKVLHEGTFNPKRLAREIKSLRRFNSPGIVKLYDVVQIDVGGGDRTALICEHISGGETKQRLAEIGKPSSAETHRFAIGLLEAVYVLHEADTWHRDIKPANILLRDGSWEHPVLIDFGLSRAATDLTFTTYPQQLGTLLYMAPEVLRGEPGRKQADLWSCGVVIYELLAGRHPYINSFEGLLPDDIVDLVVGDPFALPEGVPENLRDVTLRLLSQAAHLRGSANRALADLRKGLD